MSKTYNLLEKERNDMLQRITVLQAVREVGAFRADIYADSPDIKIEEDAETILTTYFGGYSVAEESGKFVLDEVNGEAIGKAAEGLASYAKKAGKTGMSKAIGYIPIVGDVTSFVIDTATDYEETKENFMTADWIMDNPKKAVKIMRLISDSRWYINEEKNVYTAYEKLTGETAEMSEGTEDTALNEDESEK